MGNQDNGLPLECLLNALLEDMLPHMGIHSRERVIQQVELAVGIHSTGQADPLPLSAREVDTPLPNLQTGITAESIIKSTCPPLALVHQALPKVPPCCQEGDRQAWGPLGSQRWSL